MKDTFKKQKLRMQNWARTSRLMFTEQVIADCVVAQDRWNEHYADLESAEAICHDCGQATDDYVEIDGNNYHSDVNLCILHNHSKPGQITICKVSPNPFISTAVEFLRAGEMSLKRSQKTGDVYQ